VNDWWQAHQTGERPVIYAHRRAQVDQLNSVCQRLRAEAGQLGPDRLAVGDRSVSAPMPCRGPTASMRVGKASAESLGRLYADKHGIEVVCLHIGTLADCRRPLDT
jgi:hypothetical protein